MNSDPAHDPQLQNVAEALAKIDAFRSRVAQVIRNTFDQLYDGQRTGRYRWDQLYKTEKTHCGTLIEINLQREFDFADGDVLDYKIAGVEVDCKYSQTDGAWMIPPEARGHLCLVLWAEDTADPKWSLGLVRATEESLNTGGNRDRKATLNTNGRQSIHWIFRNESLPPNILLQLDQETVAKIMTLKSGQQRVCELFRVSVGKLIGRAAVATVAEQHDYMKRVRANGGARGTLRKEGIIILGQFKAHVQIAQDLGIPAPGPGEFISVRVSPAIEESGPFAIIAGTKWRVSRPSDAIAEAPQLPETRKQN